jgi:hypothetical protein
MEFCECADMMGLPYDVWAVREFLDLETSFTAFYGDMPINKERRYFIENGKVICHHPYWPDEAFNSYYDRRKKDEPTDWKNKLDILNYESPEEIEYLSKLSCRISESFEDKWSLDWAMTKSGEWYAIDMALAKRSYHWPDCPAL